MDSNGDFSWNGAPPDGLFLWSLNQPSEVLVAGDWNGDGTSKIGVYYQGTWLLDYNRNDIWDGPGVDKLVYFGGSTYKRRSIGR